MNPTLETVPRPPLTEPMALARWAFRQPAARWLAVGLMFMGVNAAFLKLFIGALGLSVPVGSTVALEANILLRFFINDRWVFGHRTPNGSRLVKYHGAQAGAALVWWIAANTMNRAGIHYLVAGTLAIGFSTGFSFVSNFYWVWRRRHAPAPRKQVVGIVVLRDDGAALLQHRDDIPTIADPGLWVFPGGHVEPGETDCEGAVREVEEETCYRSANPRLLADHHCTELGYEGDFRMLFFWDDYDGVQRIECREGQAAAFVRREAAPNLPCRDYLTRIWDQALAARQACQPTAPRLP